MLVGPVKLAFAPEIVIVPTPFCVMLDTDAPSAPVTLNNDAPVEALVIVTAAPVPSAPPIAPVRAKTSLLLVLLDALLMAIALPVAPMLPEMMSVIVVEVCVAFWRRLSVVPVDAEMLPLMVNVPVWVLPMSRVELAAMTFEATVNKPALAVSAMEASRLPKLLVSVAPVLSIVKVPPLNVPVCAPPVFSLIEPMVTGTSTVKVKAPGLLTAVSCKISPAVVASGGLAAEYCVESLMLPVAPEIIVWLTSAASAARDPQSATAMTAVNGRMRRTRNKRRTASLARKWVETWTFMGTGGRGFGNRG